MWSGSACCVVRVSPRLDRLFPPRIECTEFAVHQLPRCGLQHQEPEDISEIGERERRVIEAPPGKFEFLAGIKLEPNRVVVLAAFDAQVDDLAGHHALHIAR